ncbi:ATP-binding protein [Antarcticirhabdus aurantiaca]|uniref:ATP-binding protein n=1 Tax=Antarcticirhabdus aurantiaca TaxID=2606717 RepID=A0ACD4NND5_9HYPH|nr:ATP-binding protein [Antarcticirhabdus aurantiaca]WAJ28338.1 ATP-binding protein [Jeongeuplla avenae]
MRSWWYRSLSGQLVAALLGALVLSQVVFFLFVLQDRRQFLEANNRAEFINRAQSLSRLVSSLPADVREAVTRSANTEHTRFWIAAAVEPTSSAWVTQMRDRFATPLNRLLGTSPEAIGHGARSHQGAAEAMAAVKVVETRSPPTGWPSDLPQEATAVTLDDGIGKGIVVPLDDGTRLNAAYYSVLSGSIFSTPFPVRAVLTAGLVVLVSLTVVRRITEPLARLTRVAETVGRGQLTEIVPQTGPDDIRHLAEAFNRMQDRLQRFVEDRTRMLAAIGHDLRTPLTTMKLRTEFIVDKDLQARMFATIDEMRVMTEAILALARQESTSEPTRLVDLGTLVESLCEDLAEVGDDVRFEGSGRITCRCRPDSLRRGLRNLVENAVRYGGEARVSLEQTVDTVRIIVRDRGPGIPVDRMEDVFTPFVRLEGSRNIETGGAGLGLSIARAIARHHGGDILLRGRALGLEAVFELPR